MASVCLIRFFLAHSLKHIYSSSLKSPFSVSHDQTRRDVTKSCLYVNWASAEECEHSHLVSNSAKWKRVFYLKGEVYKAVHPPSIWGCGGELSAHAGEHRHLRQLQPVLLQVLFTEHTDVPFQHLKRHLPQLCQQVHVITGPFLSGKNTPNADF